MKLFKWIVGLSALIIASCAAYFSVSGIALLFSGSIVGVAIMASSLELGKLVAASYLHRNWNSISTAFKIYFTSAILILILITSLGIFGYLSNAYQKTALSVDMIEQRIEVLEDKKIGLEADLLRFSDRITVLSNQRSSQETRYDSLVSGENWLNAGRTYELITSADSEISNANSQVTSKRAEIQLLNEEILEVTNSTLELSKDIGGFKFIADSFNLPINTVVKWFIITIIFVFDPLAVSLVIAFNSLSMKSHSDEVVKSDELPQDTDVESDEVFHNLGTVSSKSQEKPNEKRNLG